MLALSAFAKSPVTFQTLVGFNDVPGSILLIQNMPRVRNQGALPLCSGYTAATIAQKKACDSRKDKYPDCGNIPPEKEISPMSMVAWGRDIKADTDITNTLFFNRLSLNGDKYSSVQALYNSHKSFSFEPESCFSIDKLADKYSLADNILPKSMRAEFNVRTAERYGKLISDIEHLYMLNKKKKEQKDLSLCESCFSNQLNEMLGTHTDAEDVAYALERPEFDQFLHAVIYPYCRRLYIVTGKPRSFGYFPTKEVASNTRREDYLPKIKAILASGKPVAIDDVCIARNTGTDKCTSLHSFVIAGYKQVCSPLGKCRDAIKVHNSWGEKWQREHDDGWLDWESIMMNITDPQKIGTMGWLE